MASSSSSIDFFAVQRWPESEANVILWFMHLQKEQVAWFMHHANHHSLSLVIWNPGIKWDTSRLLWTKQFSLLASTCLVQKKDQKEVEEETVRLINIYSLFFSWICRRVVYHYINKKKGQRKLYIIILKKKKGQEPIQTNTHSTQNIQCAFKKTTKNQLGPPDIKLPLEPCFGQSPEYELLTG